MEVRSLIAGALVLFGIQNIMEFFKIGLTGLPNTPIVSLVFGVASILVAYYLLRM